MTSKPINQCQVCQSKNLNSVIFLGYLPPVNTMVSIGSPSSEQPSYPLELLRCSDCGLVQIGLEISQEVLFPESYPYLSGTTSILKSNFADLERESTSLLGLNKEQLIIDIGSNDGTLLSNFHNQGYPVLGIEPSQAADIANKQGIKTIKSYFNENIARDVAKQYGKAQLITAANVFAHISNIHSVIDGVLELLESNGVFITESHYLLDLIDAVQYDTIYHEHLRYYDLHSLGNLFNTHGLEIFHVKKIPTHGGSIRVYAARKGQRKVSLAVQDTLDIEISKGLASGVGLKDFGSRVRSTKWELNKLLCDLKSGGAEIYGVGAPSRASTLISYVGIDDGLIDCVAEVKGSHKIGKYMPGTRIPVIEESVIFEKQPDYVLMLSWHIADELIGILRKKGYKGKFIIPLPTARIVE